MLLGSLGCNPLGEPSRQLQRLPMRKTDDLTISLEDEPFVGGAKPINTRSHVGDGRDVDSPTDHCGLDIGAVDRQARGGIPVLTPDGGHCGVQLCHHFPTDGSAAVSGMRVDAI